MCIYFLFNQFVFLYIHLYNYLSIYNNVSLRKTSPFCIYTSFFFENAFDSVFTFLIGKAFCNKATCAQLELLSECYMFLFVVKFILDT